MTNNSFPDNLEGALDQPAPTRYPLWIWLTLSSLALFVGYQWLHKSPTRLPLPGKQDLFWFVGDKIYAADMTHMEQGQIWVAPQAGGTFQKSLSLPNLINPEALEITDDGIYAFNLQGKEDAFVAGEINGPTEYQMMMGDRTLLGRILKHLDGDAWEHPLWIGFTNVMHRSLSFYSWDGKVQPLALGRPVGRPVDYVQTPEYLFWVNANPIAVCYYRQDGQYRYMGRRGQSELVAVNRKTGKAEIIAKDLYLMSKNSALATDGESVYWLDLISTGYKAGKFIPRTGVRLSRYSPRTQRVTTLQEFPECAGFVALPKKAMVVEGGKLHFLLTSFVRSLTGGPPTKTTYIATSCDLNGQNMRQREFQLDGGVEITHWKQEQNRVWLAYPSGNRTLVGRLDLNTQAPFETVYRSPQDDNARGVGFGQGGFFYRRWISAEHWGKWDAKDLGLDWETRLGSYDLPLDKSVQTSR